MSACVTLEKQLRLRGQSLAASEGMVFQDTIVLCNVRMPRSAGSMRGSTGIRGFLVSAHHPPLQTPGILPEAAARNIAPTHQEIIPQPNCNTTFHTAHRLSIVQQPTTGIPYGHAYKKYCADSRLNNRFCTTSSTRPSSVSSLPTYTFTITAVPLRSLPCSRYHHVSRPRKAPSFLWLLP